LDWLVAAGKLVRTNPHKTACVHGVALPVAPPAQGGVVGFEYFLSPAIENGKPELCQMPVDHWLEYIIVAVIVGRKGIGYIEFVGA